MLQERETIVARRDRGKGKADAILHSQSPNPRATNTEKPNPDNVPIVNPMKTLDLTQPPSTTPDPDPSQDPTNAFATTHPSSLQSQPSSTDTSPKEPAAELKPLVTEKDDSASEL